MNYKEMKANIEAMANENYQEFMKGLISFEKGINDEKALDSIYQSYMENDTQGLLSDEFDYMIDNLKEQGLITEEAGIEEERDDLINIVGNIANDVEKLELKNNQREPFKVVNFTVISNDEAGKKVFHNCSAYEDKAKLPETFQKGDFVKLFGKVRKSIDEQGKEHTNVRILDSKLLKAKERAKGQEEKKESILGAIKKHKEADKQKNVKKTEYKYENER
ncbi:MAG: single-stranded DNA-binding protein [Tissierellia bacterium]|jgi:single-stranded DNA-binding protein|nr:single-stranded DNA-binding protein [Tissierellia bacterium]